MGFSDLRGLPRDLPPGLGSRNGDNLSIIFGLGMKLFSYVARRWRMLQMLHFFYFSLYLPEKCGCINYYRITNCINHPIPVSTVADVARNIDGGLKFNTNACLTPPAASAVEPEKRKAP
jgi:hypothetical protein